ncbi:MAG: PIG-L family deacetylase [Pseudomonadota bacterium]|jgi:LmbE family N-acetylglucosaminyl deacetylase|uniref:LmbE-like protein n=1 Tax=Caballeronia sordidicola TaxID=196367 RepID=A0A242M8G6_CABSO|nr:MULTISPECIES: PIG-L family deacetylase [Burkholderiaceae]AME23543.1 acetylglucosaminylphosphatidylinositol deacetylase [Burkholderia sp. PAMC 26561]MDP9154363.1 PIG-L family deacetylase [Pseudomonadota bacterium]OTP67559.1 LmbE-like protein [Caballeronia sordidicola]
MEPVVTQVENAEHNDRAIEGRGTPEAAWQSSEQLSTLPEVDPGTLVPPGARAVIVSPHPDDEILGTGGLLARLSDLGRKVLIIAVTDGTASHPDSPEWPAARLAATRPQETRDALQRLRMRHVALVRLHLPDGGGNTFESDLSKALEAHLKPGDVVFGTWRYDGHPDHESVGRAVTAVAGALDLPFVEVPVWTWHWAAPDDSRVPWSRARRISLDDATLARKVHAVQAFRSQIEADGSTGRDAILPAHVLERLTRPYEVVLI